MSGKMALLAILEFAGVSTAPIIAALIRFDGQLPVGTDGAPVWLRAAIFGATIVVSLTAMGLYQARQRLTAEGIAVRVLIGLVFAAVVLSLVYFALPPLAIGRGWWLISFVIAALLLAATRAVFGRLVDQDAFRRRVVVYGAGHKAKKLLLLRRRSDQRGFRILAFLPVPGESRVIDDERVVDMPGGLLELVRAYSPDEIVIAMDDRRQSFPIRELLDCKFAGIEVTDVLTFLERESGKVNIELLNPSWMIFSDAFTHRSSRAVLMRMFDLAASFAVLLVAWPLMLLTALAILIDDGRPVFYRQVRVGMLGKPFELIKFRSMVKNAEQGTGARWASKGDARITRVGEILRRMRLDELPQLFNVIKGDMRFIGPRPERPEFVNELASKIPYYQERHCVKPGLTGWAQLCYPYGATEKDALEKLQFDLYYVKNQSLIFDLMILLQTVEVVLWGKGAR